MEDVRAICRELTAAGKVYYRPFLTWLKAVRSDRDRGADSRRTTALEPIEDRPLTVSGDGVTRPITRPVDTGHRDGPRSSFGSQRRVTDASSTYPDYGPSRTGEQQGSDRAEDRTSVYHSTRQDLLDRLGRGRNRTLT